MQSSFILLFCYKKSNCGDTICSESSEKIIIRRSTQEQFHSEFYRMFILSVRFKKNKYRSSLIKFSMMVHKNLWSFINCQKTTHWNPISKHYELSDIYLPENTKKAPSFLKKVTQGSSKSGNNLHLSSPRRLTRKQIDWNTHPTKKKCSTTLVYFLSIKAACSRRAPHIFSTKTGMTPSFVSLSSRLLYP